MAQANSDPKVEEASNPGGTTLFDIGDRAYDPESEDGEVLVIDTPAVRASEFLIPRTAKTVADYNEDCPRASPEDWVVEVVFVDSLDSAFGVGEWSTKSILEMYGDATLDDHVSRYAYPENRLDSERTETRNE